MSLQIEPHAVKQFAVEILGCGCPDEVFQTIEIDNFKLPLSKPLEIQRILIGNRLLIYLFPSLKSVTMEEVISRLIEKGVQERDGKGYNRLRLVMYDDASEAHHRQVQIFYESLAKNDDRLFLHILDKKMLSDILTK